MKILIVDDNKAARLYAAAALSRVGHEVTAVDGGERARDLLGRGRWDALVTDWLMPGVSGRDLLASLRRPPPRVVVVTLQDDPDTCAEAHRLGAHQVLPKPVSPEALRLAVRGGGQARPSGPGPLAGPSRGPISVLLAGIGGSSLLDELTPHLRLAAHTGGVMALPAPAWALQSRAAHMRTATGLTVRAGLAGRAIEAGTLLLCGNHLVFSAGPDGRPTLKDAPLGSSSLDRWLSHLLPFAPAVRVLLLSGLGADGVKGAQQLRQAGCSVAVLTPGTLGVPDMAERALAADPGLERLDLSGVGRWLAA